MIFSTVRLQQASNAAVFHAVPIFATFRLCGRAGLVATFISLGYFLGDRWQAVSADIHRHLVIATLVLAALIALYLVWRLRRTA